jgi:23S rRNA pseudouridine1911/1915/1917 synthase
MPTRSITPDRGDTGKRLDRVLRRHLAHLPGVSRTKIQDWIDAGDVLVNGQAVDRAAVRVSAGDTIEVRLAERPARRKPTAEPIELDVLYEDDDLMAVNKPPGLVAHPTYAHASGTLLNALVGRIPAPSLIQRLDKHTSGVVLVAKNRHVHAAVQQAMAQNEVSKQYLAVVVGDPRPAQGTIDLALDRDPWDRRRVTVRDRGGVPAVTRYQRLGAAVPLALLLCRLVTGRMHQIRVHLQAKGWPLVGDPKYGPGTYPPFDDAEAERAVRAFRRQALHAWRAVLRHPVTQRELLIEAPIADDLRALMQATGLTSLEA